MFPISRLQPSLQQECAEIRESEELAIETDVLVAELDAEMDIRIANLFIHKILSTINHKIWAFYEVIYHKIRT